MERIYKVGPFGEIEDKQFTIPTFDGEQLTLLREENLIRWFSSSEENPENRDEKVIVFNEQQPLYFIPTLPSMSVVLRMDHSLILNPKSNLKLCVYLPLIPAIAELTPKNRYRRLETFPNAALSKTWFGDPESGEPAYSLNISLEKGQQQQTDPVWQAQCELSIINDSPENLSFHRLILRVPYYSLFVKEEKFYTNPITVRFKGHDQVSHVTLGTIKDLSEGYRLYSHSQSKRELLGLKKSFHFIKSLTMS